MTEPTPPDHLSHEARDWWRKLVGEYDLADPDALLLLQTVCEAFDRMRSAQAAIQKDGTTILDRFGQTKSHPALVTERDARSAMMTALRQLRLDDEPPREPGRPPEPTGWTGPRAVGGKGNA